MGISIRFRTFTLVELMVVIVIIGILVGVMIFQYVSSLDQARFAKTVEDLDTIKKAIIKYKEKFGYWPRHLSDVEYAGIITKIPTDPWGGKYEFDLCFGIVGNFETAKNLGSEYLKTKRFKNQQYFYNNNKNLRQIDKFDVRGKKLATIKLTSNGTPQNFPLGNFAIDETDNFYIIDVGKKEVRIFDRNGEEYIDEYIDISDFSPIDIEVGRSMLSGKSMYLRGKYYTPTAKLASYIYILGNSGKIGIYSNLSKELQTKITPPKTDISDLEVGGEIYLLSKSGFIYIYNLTGNKLLDTLEIPPESGNWISLCVLDKSYLALLNSTNKLYIYQYDPTNNSIWKVDMLPLSIAAAQNVSTDSNSFLYVNNTNQLNIFYFDINQEKLEEFYGPVIQEQPIQFVGTLYNIRFAGLN